MKDQITAIIPVSPMPSHPSTEVLDQTINGIRERLPDVEIIVMFDGVSPTLLHLKSQYEQFVTAMLWRINFELSNVVPIVFAEHRHQSLMLMESLKEVRTPLVLWSEQDTVLHNNIPFAELAEVIKTGYANVIRFHHEAAIPPEHMSLMLDREPIDILGQPFIRTKQWSGRPHLASTQFYKDVSARWEPTPRFIEHLLYGPISEADFEKYRLHIYAPPQTYVRHKHIDGRRYGADHYDPSAS